MLEGRGSFSLAIMYNYGKMKVVDFWSSRRGPLGTYRLKKFSWSGQSCRVADKNYHYISNLFAKLHTKETNDGLDGYIPSLSISNHSCQVRVVIARVLLKWCYWNSSFMMTSSNVITGYRWIPLTKTSDAGLWCFLWSAPEQTAGWTIEKPVIWGAMALIMTSL